MNGWAAAGIAAAVLSLIDPVPYIRDVMSGRTRPHRGTWCIWSVVGLTAFFSQWADGAGWSLLMIGTQAASMTLTFLLSLSRGVGGLGLADLAIIAGAAVGIAGWVLASEPLIATVCIILADLGAVALMLPKTWREPHSETLSTFILSAAAGGLSTVAVGAVEPELLLFPAYFALVNAATAAVITGRRRTQQSPVPGSLRPSPVP